MASLADVFVTVQADTSKVPGQLQRDLGRADTGRAGKAAGDRYSRGLSGSILPSVGRLVGAAGGLLATSGLFKVFRTGLSEVLDYQAGLAQAQQVIKTTGGVAGVSAAGVEKLATSIEGYSGQTDDSIVKSQNLLLTFTSIRNSAGANNDIFTQATKITADMAQVFGGDASASAIQLGKALNDPTAGISALSRVGVSFNEGQKKTIKSLQDSGDIMGAQKVILAELSKEVGGSAAAYGETLPGKIARAHRAFEGLSQTLVGAAAPAIEGVATLFTTKLVPAVTVFVDAFSGRSELNDFDGKLRTVNNAGILVREGFDKARAGVTTMIASFRGASGPTAGFAGVMASIGARARDLVPQLQAAFDQLRGADFSPLINGAKVAGPVLAFLAGHIDLLVKTLPFLVAGFAAYRVAQAAANVASLARIPIMAAQLGVNLSLAASNKALAASIRGSALAYNEQAGAAGRAAVAGKAAALSGGGAAGATGKAGKAGKFGAGALALAGGPAGIALAAGVTLAAGAWSAYTGGANKARDAVKQIVTATDSLGNPRPLAATRSELEKIANAKPPGFWQAGIVGQHAFNVGTKAASAALADLSIKEGLAAQAQRNMSIGERLAAAGFPPLTAAARASGDAVIAAQQANITYRDTLGQTTAALAQNGRTHDANTAAGRANQSALLGLVGAGKANLQSLVDQRAPTATLTGAVASQRAAFIKQAESMGYTKTEAAKLAASYGLIPPRVTTYISAAGDAETKERIRQVKFALLDLHDKVVNVTVNTINTGSGAAFKLDQLSKRASIGGLVRGPGTDTSDSVPMRLSRGEYVLRAAAVRRLGVSQLDVLNAARGRGLADLRAPSVATPSRGPDLPRAAPAAGYVDKSTLTVHHYGTDLTVSQLERYQRRKRLQHA